MQTRGKEVEKVSSGEAERASCGGEGSQGEECTPREDSVAECSSHDSGRGDP